MAGPNKELQTVPDLQGTDLHGRPFSLAAIRQQKRVVLLLLRGFL